VNDYKVKLRLLYSQGVLEELTNELDERAEATQQRPCIGRAGLAGRQTVWSRTG
jgi:hypothetical protein